jgi:hypothetical protein
MASMVEIMVCDTVYTWKWIPSFWRIMLPIFLIPEDRNNMFL